MFIQGRLLHVLPHSFVVQYFDCTVFLKTTLGHASLRTSRGRSDIELRYDSGPLGDSGLGLY